MFDPEISGKAVMISLALLALVVIGVIYFFRNKMANNTKKILETPEDMPANDGSLSSRVKNPAVNVFQYSGVFFNLGLLVAMASITLLINWTVTEDTVIIPEGAMLMDDEIALEDIPRTSRPPAPPPPPPPPSIIQAVAEELAIDPPDFQSMDIDEDTEVVEHYTWDEPEEGWGDGGPPGPPPPPPPPDPGEIFTIVEQMPRFMDAECEKLSDSKARDECAQKKMLQYIYQNVKYPALARENNIEGRAIITFVVESTGKISDVKLARELQGGLGEEAVRVVNMMAKDKKWVAGEQRGKKVRVRFTLPIQFKLE